MRPARGNERGGHGQEVIVLSQLHLAVEKVGINLCAVHKLAAAKLHGLQALPAVNIPSRQGDVVAKDILSIEHDNALLEHRPLLGQCYLLPLWWCWPAGPRGRRGPGSARRAAGDALSSDHSDGGSNSMAARLMACVREAHAAMLARLQFREAPLNDDDDADVLTTTGATHLATPADAAGTETGMLRTCDCGGISAGGLPANSCDSALYLLTPWSDRMASSLLSISVS